MAENRYSKNYKYQGKTFRYDFVDKIVEWIYKDDETGKWEVLDGVGLMEKNWKNKDIRDEYLFEWCMDIEEETAYEMELFMKYDWLYYKEHGLV